MTDRMNDEQQSEVGEAASRDGLAAMAILVITVVLIILVVRSIL